MPAAPNNIINQNLILGGNLAVSGSTALTGNVVAAGSVASGTSIGIITPALGTFALDFTEIAFNVDTTSATTVISFGAGGLPANAAVVGVTMRVITAITGVGFDSTDGVLSLNPNTTPVIIGTLGGTPYAVGTTDARIPGSPSGAPIPPPPPIFPVLIDDPDTAELTFFGGATSDIPSTGGSVRLTVYFFRVSAPTS
jgi:hypothetical protein